MLSLAIPNELLHFGSPAAAMLALIPFYFAYTNFSSYKQAALLTGLNTMLVHLMSSFWLAFFKDFAVFTLGASALGTGVIGAVAGLILYSPFHRYKKHTELRIYASPSYRAFIPFRILWFCTVYVLYEWMKSTGWFGYPWGTVSSAFYRWNVFIQIADITGTYGVTFLAVMFGAVLTEGFFIFLKARMNGCSTSAAQGFFHVCCVWTALFTLSFCYGASRYIKPMKPVKYLNTILVQQNADPWKKKNDNDTILLSERLTEEKLEEAKAAGEQADLIVWSEGCLKYSFPNAKNHYTYFPPEKPLIPFIQKTGIPFVLGGSYVQNHSPRKVINAAMLFDKDGIMRGAYGKNHLVPCAEVLPFSDIPAVSAFLKKTIGISAGWTPGDQYVFFDVPGRYSPAYKKPAVKVISLADEPRAAEEKEIPYVRISTPICFDDAFPDVCRPLAANGSEVFMNITDDSWSKTKSSEYQHFVISAFRAIELRTTLVRSTNSGYSAVIDARGNVLSDMPLFEEAALFCKVPVYKKQETVYLRFGNWLPHTAALFVTVFEIFMLALRNKNTEVSSERRKLVKTKKQHKK